MLSLRDAAINTIEESGNDVRALVDGLGVPSKMVERHPVMRIWHKHWRHEYPDHPQDDYDDGDSVEVDNHNIWPTIEVVVKYSGVFRVSTRTIELKREDEIEIVKELYPSLWLNEEHTFASIDEMMVYINKVSQSPDSSGYDIIMGGGLVIEVYGNRLEGCNQVSSKDIRKGLLIVKTTIIQA